MIRSRSGETIYVGEHATARAAVQAAVSDGVPLTRASLSGASLSGASLSGASLSGADLSGASLSGADLSGADLSDADLSGASLSGADLSDADLSGASLSGADLSGADLSDADLSGDIPSIPSIDAAILAAIDAPGAALNMGAWHVCETTHCRAGWAVHLAGEAGRALEDRLGPAVAGALIYAASGSHPVPDFFGTNESAMADMRRRAGVST